MAVIPDYGATPLVSAFEQEQATARRYRTARRIVWAIALVFIGVAAIDAWFTLMVRVETAPQQAAEAAEGVFFTVVPYMIARGIDAMLR